MSVCFEMLQWPEFEQTEILFINGVCFSPVLCLLLPFAINSAQHAFVVEGHWRLAWCGYSMRGTAWVWTWTKFAMPVPRQSLTESQADKVFPKSLYAAKSNGQNMDFKLPCSLCKCVTSDFYLPNLPQERPSRVAQTTRTHKYSDKPDFLCSKVCCCLAILS